MFVLRHLRNDKPHFVVDSPMDCRSAFEDLFRSCPSFSLQIVSLFFDHVAKTYHVKCADLLISQQLGEFQSFFGKMWRRDNSIFCVVKAEEASLRLNSLYFSLMRLSMARNRNLAQTGFL